MSFPDAVQSSLRQYVIWRGRASRSEYWWFYLFTILVSIVTGILESALGTDSLSNLASLALLLPSLAVTVRRLHDSGRSAWWLLATVVPIVLAILLMFAGLIAVLGRSEAWVALFGLDIVLGLGALVTTVVLMCLPSTPGPNRYGPSPHDPQPGPYDTPQGHPPAPGHGYDYGYPPPYQDPNRPA
ncbi:DUF805 domain-containing protein [Nocardioides euryhalodurans]|uniref:DUF805 domain-containing protein n=1 Tax=Nocardioides euryhalodurans TaxID=2518370 RepID=A0A4P7GIC8_9ACTN|nr:DUF805 domain-containing protein [Nocardioides euryhalodurans]QBR91439.1 DUF805 domain-containing protein [Nocardioides euryhalodurans]